MANETIADRELKLLQEGFQSQSHEITKEDIAAAIIKHGISDDTIRRYIKGEIPMGKLGFARNVLATLRSSIIKRSNSLSKAS